MRIHHLKTWPNPFTAMWKGDKTYEIRKNDRDFGVGDLLVLQEYDPRDGSHYRGQFTKRAILARVSYLTEGGKWGLPEGLCVMALHILEKTVEHGIGTFDGRIRLEHEAERAS